MKQDFYLELNKLAILLTRTVEHYALNDISVFKVNTLCLACSMITRVSIIPMGKIC